ncbi:MAG: polysaccharide biosynthesis tyrosine autokinase [Kiritimatiellia bacterium]
MKNFLGSPIQGATRAAATPPGQPPMTPALATSIGSGKGGKSFDISDFKQYFHVIVKRIWLVTLCFIIAVAVAVVSLLRQVPYYSCTAVIQINRGSALPGVSRGNEGPSGADYYAVQEEALNSSALWQRAAERMQMPGPELRAQIIGRRISSQRNTARISISIESYEPVVGSRFANVLAEEYIDFRNEQRIDESQNTVISLTQQANRIRDELRKAEEKLQAYRQANNLLFSTEGQGNFAAAQVRSLETMAAGIRNERMLLQAQQPFFADASDDIVLRSLLGETPAGGVSTNQFSNKGPEALIERNLVQSSGWTQIQRKRAQLQSHIATMQAKFTDSHPEMVRSMQEMADLDRQLEVELQFAMEDFQSKIDTLTIKEKAIGQVKLDWEEKARAAASKEDELSLYRKNVGRLESLYEVVFNRLKDIEISFGGDTESLQIIERARPASSPVSSRPVQIIFLAALIGMAVGVALVFGLEYIDDSIRYPEEVGDILGMPFFGVIPSANWDPDDLNSHMLSNIDQKSGLSEAYRNVRSAMLFSGAVKKGTALAFTSAVPKEGKTTTCLNLSVSFAQAGARVLLVDADMRRGELHKFFGLEGGRGLADILAGNSKPESLIQRTGIPNLDLVATGPFPPNPAELLLRPEFTLFVEQVKRSYDYVFFDCPPVMAVSESAVMASLADACIFVVWAGQTSRKLSQMSVRVLRDRGANLIGCVLNNLEFGRVGYYYYSTYYGYYDYDYRYEKTGT